VEEAQFRHEGSYKANSWLLPAVIVHLNGVIVNEGEATRTGYPG
jgi:hypothetical protein